MPFFRCVRKQFLKNISLFLRLRLRLWNILMGSPNCFVLGNFSVWATENQVYFASYKGRERQSNWIPLGSFSCFQFTGWGLCSQWLYHWATNPASKHFIFNHQILPLILSSFQALPASVVWVALARVDAEI